MGILSELAAPVANFGLGLYNADTYYSKECAWYEEVRMSQDTKQWLLQNNPPPIVSEDLAQVAKNNDIYKQVCDPKEPEDQDPLD